MTIINLILTIGAGIILFSVSVVLRIDFMIGLIDTFIVIIVVICVVSCFSVFIYKAIVAKNFANIFSGVVLTIAVFTGMAFGNKLLINQFYSALEYGDQLATEINTIKENEGVFPDNLSRLVNYDSSGSVPVGFFRKRPLHYFVQENEDGFVMSFPFSIWMIAYYDSISGQWKVED
ncbi:hypothetical protein ACFL0S_11110 [Thermodesulfobacteriota bacterium]